MPPGQFKEGALDYLTTDDAYYLKLFERQRELVRKFKAELKDRDLDSLLERDLDCLKLLISHISK